MTGDTFSDARLAETIAEEVLADRYVWCKGLGWLGWDGRSWDNCDDETVSEAVRQYALEQFADAVTAAQAKPGADTGAVDGWRSMLNVGRRRAVLSDCRGVPVVHRRADAFDADPDLLNTPAGVVDLRSGELEPPRPDLLMTKITSGQLPAGVHPHRLGESPRGTARTGAGTGSKPGSGRRSPATPHPTASCPCSKAPGRTGKARSAQTG